MKQLALTGLLGVALLSGCATQEFVRETVAPVQGQVKELQGRVGANEAGLKGLDGRVKSSEERIAALQQDAAARAAAAGKSQTQFLMSTLLSDDKIKFAHGRAELTPEAGAELDQLLAQLKQRNEPVFVEIQGHTDASGSDAANQRLGQARADAVRQYLARAGMPLARMATISYGETAPLADNSSRDGRSQNRRVHLVVLK
jgi:outer membrane protein OmpA-like peptidoglycan-associated protein